MRTIIINKEMIDKATDLFNPYTIRCQYFLEKYENDIIIKISQKDLKYLLFKLLDLREDLNIHVSNNL